jgi:hypothetical protein
MAVDPFTGRVWVAGMQEGPFGNDSKLVVMTYNAPIPSV